MRKGLWELLKVLPLGLILPVVLTASAVGPDDVASNISKWAAKIGIQNLPTWVTATAFDRRAQIISTAICALYAFLVWGVPHLRRKRHDEHEAISIPEACRYIYQESRWAFTAEPDVADRLWLPSPAELLEAAEAGKIKVFGRHSGLHEEIPASYWRTAYIDLADVVNNVKAIKSKPKIGHENVPIYSDLIVYQDSLCKEWPRAGFFLRLWVRHKPHPKRAIISPAVASKKPYREIREQTLRGFYTVRELGTILRRDPEIVKDALALDGVRMIHKGKEVSADQWGYTTQPHVHVQRDGSRMVTTGRGPRLIPDPGEVVVATDSLSESLKKELLAKLVKG